MPKPWAWPGSRWWRVDLHTHSPASHDFKDDRDWDRWVAALIERNINAVAVTDHNTAEGIAPLKAAAQDSDLVLFPGVEVTVGGIHLLVILDPDQGTDDVTDILTRLDVPVNQRGRDDARSPLSVESALATCGSSPVVIAAHVNAPAGLLDLAGAQRLKAIQHPNLAAVEIDPSGKADTKWIDGGVTAVRRRPARVWASDAHSFDKLGQRYTWIKMTTPSSDGLRLALGDGSLADSPRSLQPWTVPDPNEQFASNVLESITVANAKHVGRPNSMSFHFNPWFNAIIGGRGTGKSSLIDFCRQTLRREAELPSTLRQSFDRRLSVPGSRGDEGLLTPETRITVTYRKDGERFDLSWSSDGHAPPVVRLATSDDHEEQGDISRRFPVRLYSQRQLFETAQNPNALLDVIDDSREVQGAELRRSMNEAKSRYLACRSRARLARQRATALPDLVAQLSDVRRKLDVLQEADRANILAHHRRSRQRNDEWEAVRTAVRHAISAVRKSTNGLVVPDLGTEASNTVNGRDADLDDMHKSLHDVIIRLRRQIHGSLESAENEIERIRKGPAAVRWNDTRLSNKQRFEAELQNLANQGISGFDDYQEFLAEASTLEREVRRVEEQANRSADYEQQADRALTQYRELRQELANRRRAYAVDASGEVVKIRIQMLHDASLLLGTLAKRLGTDRFEPDRSAICQQILLTPDKSWRWDRLDTMIAKMRRSRGGEADKWESRDGRFDNVLQRIDPEQLDRLALYAPDDSVLIEYRDASGNWKKLAQGSPGQQAAALLAFVLRQGEEPIILDQPEDDLDNTVIYELLVATLREVKVKRQIIVVTHNPNIVVHADAEYVMSLRALNGQTHVECEGGLQDRGVRQEICRVMEGGEEAFRKRYRRIVPSDDNNNG